MSPQNRGPGRIRDRGMRCLIYHDRAGVQRREIEALRGEVEALRSQRGA